MRQNEENELAEHFCHMSQVSSIKCQVSSVKSQVNHYEENELAEHFCHMSQVLSFFSSSLKYISCNFISSAFRNSLVLYKLHVRVR